MASTRIKTGLISVITLASLLYSVTVIFKIDWLTILNLAPPKKDIVIIPIQTPLSFVTKKAMAALPPIKPRTIVLTNEKIKNVKAAIKKGDYNTANQIATDYLNQSTLPVQWNYYPFTGFIGSMKFLQDEVLLDNLNKWIAQEPQSVIAHLLRACYYDDVAWQIRGNGFSSQVSTKAGQTFHDYLQLGKQDAYQAIKLNENNPFSYQLLLRILSNRGDSEELEQAFQRAIKKFPDFYPLYQTRLSALQPKWGGSIEEMYQFTDRYAGKAADNSPLKFLYLQLYEHLLDTASITCNGNTECIAQFMNTYIEPHLTAEIETALNLYNKTDQFQFNLHLDGILQDLIKKQGGEYYVNTILQSAGSHLGYNHYVLDKITALTWCYTYHFDDCEKKLKDALLDVEHAPFPNEEEKIFAIANIYDDVSVAYERTQFYKAIAYQNAIVALIGGELSDNIRCRMYSNAFLYQEAIQECTDFIKQQGSAITTDAYFYRARDYEGLKKQEEALQDYTVVADTDNSYHRTSAATEISIIYNNMKNPNATLQTFEKYPFLFDEDYQITMFHNKEGKHNLSIGYNNRCYAYMQLGEYQKALDDCTTSLKYDNIPDAYQKQQELIKKLSPTPAAPTT